MSLLCFLNELSEQPPAPDEIAGRARLERLLDTLLAVKRVYGATKLELRTAGPIDAIELAEGYPVARWKSDADVLWKRRQLFLQFVTETPFLRENRDSIEAVNNELLSECLHEGRPARGLSAARAAEGLSVSIASDPCWDKAWLDRVVIKLIRDGLRIEETTERLRHASAAVHVIEHEHWLRELKRLSVKDGRDLWDRRATLFPKLDFCKGTKEQLEEFRSGDRALKQVVRRLDELQKFFEEWSGEPFGPEDFPSKCSPESRVTLAKYEDEHTFTLPDGERRVFSWHVRFTPDPGRIFFDGDARTGKGVVGCIARQGLPTVRDPT